MSYLGLTVTVVKLPYSSISWSRGLSFQFSTSSAWVRSKPRLLSRVMVMRLVDVSIFDLVAARRRVRPLRARASSASSLRFMSCIRRPPAPLGVNSTSKVGSALCTVMTRVLAAV